MVIETRAYYNLLVRRILQEKKTETRPVFPILKEKYEHSKKYIKLKEIS